VDIDAFCERYARLLIDEAQERAWLIQEADPADRYLRSSELTLMP